MIRLRGISKSYKSGLKKVNVFNDIDLDLPDRRCIGVIGAEGCGKSTLLRMLCRREKPDKGILQIDGQVSTPLAAGVGFTHGLTGRENIKFIARLLGVPAGPLINEVADLAQLGEDFDRQVSDYDQSERQRLVFASILAAEYDWYLADEKVTPETADHRERFLEYFKKVKERAGIVIASGNEGLLSQHCDSVVLLNETSATYYEDVESGLELYRKLQTNGDATQNSD